MTPPIYRFDKSAQATTSLTPGAYSAESNTLFTVTGKYLQLIELTLDGQVMRRIDLHGFVNPEGVEMLSNGRLAIIDERKRTLTTFKLGALTRSLEFTDLASFDLGFADAGNKGFEGIAWDSRNERVLLGKERGPLGLFSLPFPGEDGATGALQPVASGHLFLRDISSLTYDARTGHALVLSDESRLLLEVDEQGEPVSFISLSGGMNGLNRGIAQAEGVTMDAAGNIYIVSEPRSTVHLSVLGSMCSSGNIRAKVSRRPCCYRITRWISKLR
ncbi:SdiA-regulated domain-containing protein [Pseudomonas sp.]|uniref:SdiA-regulated domain-containing protein n=1 Tax=Pseudomonas sp. TaxID=306 RepID=UPI0040543EC5